MTGEVQTADQWLVATLTASTALMALATSGVWSVQAPDGTNPPYIVFNPATIQDTNTNGSVRVLTEIDYQIRCTTLGNDKVDADQMAYLVDLALHGQRAQTGGYQIDCWRTAPLSSLAAQSGRDYRYAGGRYHVSVRKL